MKISICMPVFGRERMVADALCSLLMQDHEDWELVVQDGCVGKPVIADHLVKTLLDLCGFGRVKYECKPDPGNNILHCVNDCLRRSTGDILYLMCSDDLLCPGALSAVNEVFYKDRFGGPLWLYGQTISADFTGRTLGIDGTQTTYKELLQRNRIGSPAAFWNRQIMDLLGRFDARYRYAADYDMWLRFWRQCEPRFLGQTLGVHRHHSRQATRVHSAETEREAAAISWRHSSMAWQLDCARRTHLASRFWPDGVPPESVN